MQEVCQPKPKVTVTAKERLKAKRPYQVTVTLTCYTTALRAEVSKTQTRSSTKVSRF